MMPALTQQDVEQLAAVLCAVGVIGVLIAMSRTIITGFKLYTKSGDKNDEET